MIKLGDLRRFPLNAQRKPMIRDWPNRAATAPSRLGRGPYVGVLTGPENNIAVLDIDPAGMPWLAENECRLPTTRRHHTPRGGRHLYFRYPEEGLRNSAGRIAEGVDTRGWHGFAVWYPECGLAVENEGELADWPVWLVVPAPSSGSTSSHQPPGHLLLPDATDTLKEEETIFRRFKQTAPRFSLEDTIGWSATNRAFTNVSRAGVGQRNHILNGEGYALGRIVVRGWLNGGNAVFALAEGAKACGYVRDHGEAETVRAIRHALLDGMRNPYPDVVPRVA